MNQKSILIILAVIIIVAIGGFVSYNQFSAAGNNVEVGSAIFSLPDGFNVGPNHKNDTNITNGYDTVLVRDCGSDNVSKYIKKYIINEKYKDNTTKIKLKNFTVDNTVVYKAYPVNHTSDVRYWFEHNGEVYLFYHWNASDNFENIVTDLIKSVK